MSDNRKEKRRTYDKAYRAIHKEERNAYNKAYHEAHKEEINEKHRLYLAANKEKIRAQRKVHNAANREKNHAYYENNKDRFVEYGKKRRQTPEGRFAKRKSEAKLREIEFDLTFEQFMTLWQKPCEYCSGPIETIGLDRVDSNLGYSVLNIVPCCWNCNRAKGTLSQEEFLDMCHNIIVKHSGSLDKS